MSFFPSIRRVTSVFLAAAGSILLANCAGYQMGSDKPGRMLAIEKIAVPVFKNQTLEPRSSVLVTNAVVREFQTDGTYQIVDTSRADAIVRGTIKKFERRQLRSARNNTLRTRELELRILCDFTVEDRAGGIIMRGQVDGATHLFLDANFQLSEREAINDAAEKLAGDLVSRIAEGWGADELTAPENPSRKKKAPKSRNSLNNLMGRPDQE
jgi:hypothetical protein